MIEGTILPALAIAADALSHILIKNTCTVGPRLSGYQLYGYLYYPAMILQYNIVYFQLMSCSRQKQSNKYLFYFIVYPFYTNDNLLQIE